MNPTPEHPQSSVGWARRTVASNPAQLRVDLGKAIAVRPAALILCTIFILAGITIALTVQPPWIGGVFILAAVATWMHHSRDVSKKFMAGDVCPGIVLSDKLVAVATNMAAGSGVRPAIKVIRYPLSKMTGGLPPAGTRVATVALYRGPAKDGAWRDFTPEVIGCWVKDEVEIQRVTNSISEPEWRNLDTLLSRIPQPVAGLYKMWGAEMGKVKPATDPAVQGILTALFIAIIFGPMIYGVIYNWRKQHPQPVQNPAPAAPAVQEPSPAIAENPTPPATPRSAPTAAPARSGAQRISPATGLPTSTGNVLPTISPETGSPVETPATPAAPKPAPLAAIDLGGQLMTFTNLQGKNFENVKLVKADPRGGLIYSFDGGEGAVPLGALPIDFLVQLGVPTNWPSVMQGRPGVTPPRVPGTFLAGDRVVVQWGGKWQPATIVKFENYNIVVHFTDPSSHVYNDLHVPTNWVQFAR
jgi:hypothetical protein